MNDNPAEVDTDVRTTDQQAVVEYLASERYAHRKQHFATPTADLRESQSFEWPVEMTAAASLLCGLGGLCGLVIVFGALMPAGMELTEALFQTRPNFISMMFVMQTIAVPPIIAFSVATVTPMFWFGSVIVRFLMGILCVTPGCIAFYIGMLFFDHGTPSDFVQVFSAVMFAQFLAAATVALIVQMWSRWTLSHARDRETPLPPLGTRAMMELTFVAAVGFAVFMSVDIIGIMEGLLFFAVAGLVTSLAVIAVLIALLRERQRNAAAAFMGAVAAFATAFLFNSFVAVAEFGWNGILYNLVTVCGLSLYGGALIYGVMWLCIWWLRLCGWRCISRDEEKEERARAAVRFGST